MLAQALRQTGYTSDRRVKVWIRAGRSTVAGWATRSGREQVSGDTGQWESGTGQREPTWTAGLTRLAEELEAFTDRLVAAQRVLSATEVASPPPPAPRGGRRGGRPRAASGMAALRERLDATEDLVAQLEEERRRDGAIRTVALNEAARRLQHVQRVIEVSQQRLVELADPAFGDPATSVAEPGGVAAATRAAGEGMLRRVTELETRVSSWEHELTRQADLLERLAETVRDTESDLAARDDLELQIAELIERVTRTLARATEG